MASLTRANVVALTNKHETGPLSEKSPSTPPSLPPFPRDIGLRLITRVVAELAGSPANYITAVRN